MIEVRDLCKTYPTRFGENVVLDGISFRLARGEKLGIIGRNGAGKSTLVRLISGAEKPTSGTITRDMSVSWPLAFGGGFQPQLTGIDNVRFITSIYGQEFESNLAFVEEFAELGKYLREPVRSYSSGMRARLAFAISMIIEFDCFLIDEVNAVGDARFHERCARELFEKRGDRAMIIISHDASYLRDHCNRWALLDEGHLHHFNAFPDAYAAYRESLARLETKTKPELSLANRSRLIASSQTAALADPLFRLHVQQGDWARDDADWETAEREYVKALSSYPFQRSYWVQKGHVCKEQGKLARAEIAYRTAIALGEPEIDIAPFLADVMARQELPFSPPSITSPEAHTAEQLPSLPDLDAFAWLMADGKAMSEKEQARLLREHASCDSLLAELVDEHGVPQRSDVLNPDSTPDDKIQRTPPLSRAVIAWCLLCKDDGPMPSENAGAVWDALVQSDALKRWPRTRTALAAQERKAPALP